MATQTIHVFSAGADRLTWVVEGEEKTGKDVSGANITTAICLSNTGPTSFTAPEYLTRPTVSTYNFADRINNTTVATPGEYEYWVKVGDGSEIIPELVAYFNVD